MMDLMSCLRTVRPASRNPWVRTSLVQKSFSGINTFNNFTFIFRRLKFLGPSQHSQSILTGSAPRSISHELIQKNRLRQHSGQGIESWQACHVSSSPVPLKTRRVGQRCTLNLSRAETSSRWFDDLLPICAIEIEEVVDLTEPIDSGSDAEIDNEIPIKTVAFFALYWETVITYLMKQNANEKKLEERNANSKDCDSELRNEQPLSVVKLKTDSKKIGYSYPLDADDLIEFMTVYDNKEVDNDEVEGEVQLLTTDLILEGLKFVKSMEQHFIIHDHNVERALKFIRNLL
ncbi:hypothetical protein TNCV_1347391 [Trichonephila clavipes]|nr:hypothetical protein TNCV_1347391 [Trichonephila clavipes]